jgi:hypothetical protein
LVDSKRLVCRIPRASGDIFVSLCSRLPLDASADSFSGQWIHRKEKAVSLLSAVMQSIHSTQSDELDPIGTIVVSLQEIVLLHAPRIEL